MSQTLSNLILMQCGAALTAKHSYYFLFLKDAFPFWYFRDSCPAKTLKIYHVFIICVGDGYYGEIGAIPRHS